MTLVPWAALVSAIASIIVGLAAIWVSRGKNEASALMDLTNSITALNKANAELTTRLDAAENRGRQARNEHEQYRRETDARIEALERSNKSYLIALELYHEGAVANDRHMRAKGITPIFVPTGLTWRGDGED